MTTAASSGDGVSACGFARLWSIAGGAVLSGSLQLHEAVDLGLLGPYSCFQGGIAFKLVGPPRQRRRSFAVAARATRALRGHRRRRITLDFRRKHHRHQVQIGPVRLLSVKLRRCFERNVQAAGLDADYRFAVRAPEDAYDAAALVKDRARRCLPAGPDRSSQTNRRVRRRPRRRAGSR